MLGGAVIFSPLVQACAPQAPPDQTVTGDPQPTAAPPADATSVPVPTATAVPKEEAGMATIALVKTQDRADGVRRAIELLRANGMRGDHVLLKPNFNSADEAPGSTHADVLRALAVELSNAGARSITVADRSGMGDTRAVMQRKGVFDLAEELGLNTIVFDELAETDWVVQQSPDYHWSQGYAVPRTLLDADAVVQTCNLKTHRYGGHFTLSLKNSVGLAAKTVPGDRYDYMSELHGSSYQRHMIAEINTAYTPALIVMDGVEAFVEGGPATGKKVSAEVVLAGTDRVAIDAVGVAILRLFGTTPEVSRGKVFDQEQIARAVELGLGVDSPDKIQFVTGDAASDTYAQQVRETLIR